MSSANSSRPREWRASQRQPLQTFKPLEIAIETHQAPAIGDRQGRQIGIGTQTGRQLTAAKQQGAALGADPEPPGPCWATAVIPEDQPQLPSCGLARWLLAEISLAPPRSRLGLLIGPASPSAAGCGWSGLCALPPPGPSRGCGPARHRLKASQLAHSPQAAIKPWRARFRTGCTEF